MRIAPGEMHRALRPGGLALLAFHVGDRNLPVKTFLGKAIDVRFWLFPVDFMERGLADAGFAEVETLERPPCPEGEYPSRRAYMFARKPGG